MPKGSRAVALVVTCGVCSSTFESYSSKPAKYCSVACKREKGRHRNQPPDYQKTRALTCGFCGVKTKGRPGQIYCSRSCIAKAGWRSGRLTPIERVNKRWHRRLAKYYGLTAADYYALLEVQGGGCAICGAEFKDASGKRLCVDHDHDTGAVRGLLCNHCNRGIGMLGDSAERLLKAVAYLSPPA